MSPGKIHLAKSSRKNSIEPVLQKAGHNLRKPKVNRRCILEASPTIDERLIEANMVAIEENEQKINESPEQAQMLAMQFLNSAQPLYIADTPNANRVNPTASMQFSP